MFGAVVSVLALVSFIVGVILLGADRARQASAKQKFLAELRDELEAKRVSLIREALADVPDIAEMLIRREIAPDMNKEMVMLAWGSPDEVDQEEITAETVKKR